MPFLINEAYLPATLTVQPMGDEEFAAFCAEHPDLDFEMTAEGELLVMAPTFSSSGASRLEVAAQLRNWARISRTGIVCDSSTGFVLPNGARRSPDASWTAKVRVQALGEGQRNAFWHLCPDFVVEVKSSTDRLKALTAKMQEYLEQGAKLGWLIDPEGKSVTVFRPGVAEETVLGVETIAGEGPVEGFTLDLTTVWDPLA